MVLICVAIHANEKELFIKLLVLTSNDVVMTRCLLVCVIPSTCKGLQMETNINKLWKKIVKRSTDIWSVSAKRKCTVKHL